MTNANNFELVAELEIAELKTQARLYRHRATGARVLSLENDDENKVFGITFATPPTDRRACRISWSIRCCVPAQVPSKVFVGC